ncbi:hypothetical protein V2J09_013944 [Rumex salicifolius]
MAVSSDFFQIFVRLLDNKTLTLQLPIQSPTTGDFIKQQIQSLAQIPCQFQKLSLNGRFIDDQTLVSPKLKLSTIQLNFSLLGGKGGFGSLLRGAATKAGQKKTNNFDACRDMSGRRLRHVNAEKKLEEWMAEEEQRKLEKAAEGYIKKMTKAAKKKGGGAGAEKYVQKYREDSAKCVEEVERSVRESVGELLVGKKRKVMEKMEAKAVKEKIDSKKLKIWMKGKRTMGESDSDSGSDSDNTDEDESDNSNVENEKSAVIDNVNHSDSSKELEGSSDANAAKLVYVDAGGSPESGFEEEKDLMTGGSSDVSGSPSGRKKDVPGVGVAEPSSDCEDHKMDTVPEKSGSQDQQMDCSLSEVDKEICTESTVCQPSINSVSQELVGSDSATNHSSAVVVETPNVSTDILEMEDRPISLDDISFAAELEVFGMEKLKTELQARGLKCGGTLQERAARLFLLKTTPIEKIPKKLLAKK